MTFAIPLGTALGKVLVLVQDTKYRARVLEKPGVVRDPWARIALVDRYVPSMCFDGWP